MKVCEQPDWTDLVRPNPMYDNVEDEFCNDSEIPQLSIRLRPNVSSFLQIDDNDLNISDVDV